MSSANNYKHLLVSTDTFMGYVEAFPIQAEQAQEVAKALLKNNNLSLWNPKVIPK